ncbi:hypothetical protein [Shinella sp. NM-101]|uniref:DUF4376 domain-containing protein n=1 Tax=Shinella sp. NM-101 TaxID=2744455 RepID=UPI001F358B48|nr:hypothetical protein [Shinella sp. NM-101]
MVLPNTRSDLESLRGTPAFEACLRGVFGSMTTWVFADGAWVAEENLQVIERLGYTKAAFLAEVAPFSFPEAGPPPVPAIAAPAVDDVIAERERRLALGFDFDFGDARGIHHIGTTPDDMRKWMDEVTPFAQAYLNAAQPAGEIEITTNTGKVAVTAAEWQLILLAAGAYRQPIYSASFDLQAMVPIPADFADNSHWQ